MLIAVVEKDNAILMRKKPKGSLPYNETWYLFGCERVLNQEDSITIHDYLRDNFGIEVDNVEPLGQGGEIKKDHDGVLKDFTYLDFKCRYDEGDIKEPEGIEKIEWIQKDKLGEYDLVPPSVKLFKKMGYMES